MSAVELKVLDVTETTIKIGWEKIDKVKSKTVIVSKMVDADKWGETKEHEVLLDKQEFEVSDLTGTSTYKFQLKYTIDTGEEKLSKEAITDTAVENCTPDNKCCVVS
eukprot:maker-scaffold_6-snap-gene-10.4-mRNA-1 protein AED:0.00 eAED:0.00 QI:35/1/1/1/0/0/4/146/106